VTRKDPTKAGKYRPGYEEVLRLVDAGAVDVVYCWKWDRFIREPLDLEFLIPRFDKAGVRFAEADGNIDLGTDSGRLARPHPGRGGQGRAGTQVRAAEAGQRGRRRQRASGRWARSARSGTATIT
jgi:DNA invertase Pin-like site-specific DNA recombinase